MSDYGIIGPFTSHPFAAHWRSALGQAGRPGTWRPVISGAAPTVPWRGRGRTSLSAGRGIWPVPPARLMSRLPRWWSGRPPRWAAVVTGGRRSRRYCAPPI